ncbi:MAG TPA: ABC transporter permease [Longimicrobiales bacterium]|nr:ABC transporter permease [Longimicrobiales bacterium]
MTSGGRRDEHADTRDAAPRAASRSIFPWRSRREVIDDVNAEIAYHLEARAAELERQGYAPADARAEARRRFGDIAHTRDVCTSADLRRQRRHGRREQLGEIVQDARLGVRQLARRPAFALVAVATLGLGIGANAAIFAVIDHLLLRPLPFPDVERVMTVWETDPQAATPRLEGSTGNFLDWRERATLFDAMGAVEWYAYDVFTDDGPPESVRAARVAGDWFAALGVQPLLGRVFDAAEHDSPEPRVALISEAYWQRRYGGATDVIGRRIRLDEGAAEIIGVLPVRQLYPDPVDIWTPKYITPADVNDRRSSYLPVVARLRAGATRAQAQAELDAIARQLAAEHPQTNARRGVALLPLREHVVGSLRPALVSLAVAVGLLLLIACTNLANLLLARGAERQRELSVRSALGAGRGRLVRQMATESAVLAMLGAVVGVAVAAITLRAVGMYVPGAAITFDGSGLDQQADFLGIAGITLDWRSIAYLTGITGLAALLFATLPTIGLSRPDLMPVLRGTGGLAPHRQRLRATLVSAGVAIAMVLLIGAGLLAHSFARLTANDLGFAHEDRAFLQTFLWDRNPTHGERTLRVTQILERLAAVPGVTSVAGTSALPFHLSAITARGHLRLHDAAAQAADDDRRVFTTIATPGWFATMQIPVIAGREFTTQDRTDAPQVAVVNEALARTYFPDGNAIGSRITIGVMAAPVEREIVGIVGDSRTSGFDTEPQPELFVPHAQQGTGSMTFVVATARPAAAMQPALHAALWEVDPQQTVYSAGTMERLVNATLAERRLYLLIVGLVALFAFLLATVGIYGLITYWTGMRTREIGVRLALGARPADIIRMIVAHGLRLVVPGVLIGIAGAAAFATLLRHMLYGTSAIEPVVYAQLAALVLLVAALAAWVPARRAIGRDPVRALRE